MENIGDNEPTNPYKGAPAILDYSLKEYESYMKHAEEHVVYPLRYDWYISEKNRI
jgi:hypothetical protein